MLMVANGAMQSWVVLIRRMAMMRKMLMGSNLVMIRKIVMSRMVMVVNELENGNDE